jgi:hypothetical protein
MKKVIAWILPLAVGLASGLMPQVASASDHADPIFQKAPESNITDLFFYPKDDRMVLIFDVRRALLAPKPYNLTPFDYVIYMDLHSQLTFASGEDRERYGATITSPEGIKPDVTITLHLNDDTTLKDKSIQGLKDPDSIRVWTGVRDDPFIFPRFFKKNTIATVMSIPLSSFPSGQQDFLLWGATYKDGQQIDHVGRSNRTQLVRFDALNPLPPSQHVAEIMKLLKQTQGWATTLNKYKETTPLGGLVQYVFQIRKYDLVPDVMVYTTRYPPGFPNGRRLTDDVAALTCSTGDCILQELSFIEGGWPRQTVNDKPFTDEFPYLAEPWPEQPQMPPVVPSIWPWVVAALVANLIVNSILFLILRALVRLVVRRFR